MLFLSEAARTAAIHVPQPAITDATTAQVVVPVLARDAQDAVAVLAALETAIHAQEDYGVSNAMVVQVVVAVEDVVVALDNARMNARAVLLVLLTATLLAMLIVHQGANRLAPQVAQEHQGLEAK